MSKKNNLTKTASAVLEEPVYLDVDITPKNRIHAWAQKNGWLPAKKEFKLRPLNLGTMVRISQLLMSIDISDFQKKESEKGGSVFEDAGSFLEANFKTLAASGETMARMIAAALHNNQSEVPEKLVKMVLQEFNSKELLSTVSIIVERMDVANFMSSIISIRRLNTLEVSPSDQGRSIASGDLSAEL